MEKQRRIAEYFVIAGLPESPTLFEDDAGGGGAGLTADGAAKPTAGRLEPITDICVIFPSENELCPPGYKLLALTPGGLPADLNHGSIRSPEVFLCYRKGRDKPPLTDLGVLYEGKERVLPGCEVITSTPYGRCANVNNSSSNKIFLTYRRASENAASDTLAVTDICVIVTNKGETPPHSYCLINRNLNKGTIVGSSVYLCYKKSVSKDCTIVYRPGLLDRYPREDYEDFPLPSLLPVFAMPMGAVLESWPEKADHPKPVFSSFVLTGADGEKLYGAAVTFYEPYPLERLKQQQAASLGLMSRSRRNKSVHVNKAVCIVSRWPFFEAFRKFLFFIRSLACRPTRPAVVPVERYIEHFMFDVPFPSHHRPRIMVQLGSEYLLLTQPDDSPIPLSGASFLSMLRNLGAEKCMNVLTYVLTEHKLVVHSLRPAVLTVVIEAIGSMIFPFRWQCPYIPLCPLELSGVLSAPTPFIVGIDSQYFDVCEPPPDITCVDLDTGTVLQPDDKKGIDHRLLPKRPAKVLRATLEAVIQQMLEVPPSAASAPDGTTGIDFKQKQRETSLENTVQESFLRFMAAILKGYRSYLLPITTAPDLATTSAHMLFDMKGFLKSRDGAYHKFFAQMLNTQLFIRFIEERSFNSNREISLAFFDECTEKVDENVDTPRLLEADSKGEHTVFITPPDLTGGASPTKETSVSLGSPARDAATSGGGSRSPQGRAAPPPGVGCFPLLNHDLLRRTAGRPGHGNTTVGGHVPKDGAVLPLDGYVAKRTKAEVKLAQKVAVDCKNSYSSLQWAKCLLSTAYSIWFMQLAALAELAPVAPRDALRAALTVLRAMHEQRLHAPDEVCYRALMLLCGSYQQPVLAVQALYEMRQHGISPNAVTYGVYNKAVLESRWPSTQSTARVMWRRVRLALEGVARFRLPLLSRKAGGGGGRRGSLVAAASTQSLASIASDVADGDSQSRDSLDSEDLLSVSSTGLSMQHYIAQPGGPNAVPKSKEPELLSTESDMGYNSTSTAEDPLSMNMHEKELSRYGSSGSPVHSSLAAAAAAADVAAVGTQLEGSGDDALLSGQKPVKVKPEQPKAMVVTNDDPLGLFSPPASTSSTSTTVKQGSMPSAPALAESASSKAKSTTLLKSMDIGGLFGRSASVDAGEPSRKPAQTARQPYATTSAEDVSRPPKRATAAPAAASSSTSTRTGSCSPLDGDAVSAYDELGSAGGYVKKSDSLDSRVSIVSSGSSSGGSTGNGSALSDQSSSGGAVAGSSAVGSNDRLAATSAAVMKGLASRMFKSLLPKATKNGDTLGTSHESLTADSTDGAQQSSTSGQQQQHASSHRASSPRRPAVPRALGVVSALSRSGSISNRLVSVTNVVTNKLHDKYNSLVQTVMEIQAPSTIAVSARTQQQQDGGGGSGGGRSTDGVAGGSLGQPQVTSHSGAPMHDGGSSIGSDQLSLSEHRNDSIADSMDDYFAAMDDHDAIEQSTAQSNTGLLSPTFTEQYTPRSAAVEATSSNMATSCSSTGNGLAAADGMQCCCTVMEAERAQPCSCCAIDAAPAVSGRDAGSAIIEVEICSCNECGACGALLYDEEIMAGWSADDSNLNSVCPFCTSKLVPFLSVVIKDLRAPSCRKCQTSGYSVLKGSNGHSADGDDSRCNAPNGNGADTTAAAAPEAAPLPSEAAATSTPSCESSLPASESAASQRPARQGRVVGRASVPYLSPLVLRKELENVLDVEGDQCLYSADFVDQHPIIYWNMIWLFRRLNLVSHMPGFVLTAKGCGVCMPASDRQRPGRRHDEADGPSGSCGVADGAPVADALPRSDASSVRVRTVWDSAEQHQQLEGRLGRPMYATWQAAGHRGDRDLCLPVLTDVHADVSEEDFAKIVMQQIIRGIESSDMHAPILLLLEHRQQLLTAGAAPTVSGDGGHATAINGDSKAKFRSIYREMLFLGFVHFGKDFLEHDAFDREYKHAFKQLTPEQRALLQRSDYPPSPAVMWCRKLFGQLEVS